MNNRESKIIASMEHSYKKEYPSSSDEDARNFSSFMMSELSASNMKHKNNPIRILTTSFNVRDGIGDYVNQADFTSWLVDFFKSYENIKIQSISIFEASSRQGDISAAKMNENKLALAKRITPDNLQKEMVTINNVGEFSGISDNSKYILLHPSINGMHW